MASPAQAYIRRRKLIYLGVALILFVVNTFLWRGVTVGAATAPPAWTIAAQADALELTELSVGEADLTGSAVRLLLTGSHGIAQTCLWYQADEKKKKHEWNKLELIVKTLTKLQPHSPAPWNFQSWNISYNVSVESDRVRDKYFYIVKGIELLAEGIRLNRDQPDLRYMEGFYYQNKFGVSDEANYLRALFSLSCINPRDRDAARMRTRSQVDEKEFQKFVRDHPHFCRRLKEKLNYGPAEIVDFVEDGRHLPCRYYLREVDGKEGPKPPEAAQFPTLPMERPRTNRDLIQTAIQSDQLPDEFTGHGAALAWFMYSQDPLPPAKPQTSFADIDRKALIKKTKKRIPRSPALVLFRHLPARAQAYIAEWYEKEGWFDEAGWNVDADRSPAERWFPSATAAVIVGNNVNWAEQAWSRAFLLWDRHGKENGLYLDAAEHVRLEERAKPYRERYRLNDRDLGKDISEENVDSEMKAAYEAHMQLYFYDRNRETSNFDHHYFGAQTEKDRATIAARKLLYEAARLRKAREAVDAMAKFEEAFAAWKKVLVKYKQFREDVTYQEDIYELQVNYMDLVQVHRGPLVRPAVTVAGILAAGTAVLGGDPICTLPAGTIYGSTTSGRPLPIPFVGPFDEVGPDGHPWIVPTVAENVMSRMGKTNPPAAGPPPAPVPPEGRRI